MRRALEIIAQYRSWDALRADDPGLDDEALRQVLAFAAAEVDGRVSWLLRVIPPVERDLIAGAVVSVDLVTVRVRRLPISHATP